MTEGHEQGRTRLRSWFWILPIALALVSIETARAEVLVFAAASLKNAFDEVAALSQQVDGISIRVSYAASSALARQIENGAPADLFVSADLDWMNYLEQRALIEPASRVNLLGNRLVLIAPVSSAAPLSLDSAEPVLERLGDGRLAVADPDHVPAGKYARAALMSVAVWPSVVARLAPAESVRAALAMVSRGEAPLGVVYDTDARADTGVAVVAMFPLGSHPPIVYPAALVAGRRTPETVAVLARLRSEAAAERFRQWGFAVPAVFR